MISAVSVSKRYGPIEACADISFDARPGEVTALLGPNGAGKSTILKILSGVLSPTSGSVTVCGSDAAILPLEARRHTGCLFEDAPLYDGLTVSAQLRFMAAMHGVPRRLVRDTVDRLVETCSLSSVAGRLAGGLSRGFRQRAGLAMALVHDPSVLLLDEPTAGLDPLQLDGFRTLVRNLAPGKTIILSTHIMQEVESLCSSVIMLDRGRLIEKGTIPEICRRTGTPTIEKAFMALAGRREGSKRE